MRVVVTGGSGFIGSHVVEALHRRGCEVVSVDLNASQYAPEGVEALRLDVRDEAALREVLREVDAVVHLAALVDARESLYEPSRYHDVNVGGTLALLKACRDAGVGRVVLASSAAVYGNPARVPVSEDHPLRPLNPYGATKVACEAYASAFHHSYGLPVVILRIFNAYGPRQTRAYAGVVSIFVRNALMGRPLVIYGDGEQTRDFIYVSDVVRAIVAAVESGVEFGVFNVGTGRQTSVNELARLVLELTGRPDLQVVHREGVPGDVRHSCADVTRIARELGWRAEVGLREGLRRTIEWYRSGAARAR